MTTLTSRQFNQHASEAKKATENGPVFITDRGQAKHVLLSIEDYYRLSGSKSIVDMLAMGSETDIDFDPPRVKGIARPADLS